MGHLVCQTDLSLKLPASLDCYTRFSSTCMEPDFLHSLFLPKLDRKGKSKERGNERNLSLSPFNNVITGLRHGAAFTHDEIELTSESKGPLLLHISWVVKSIKGISKQITWCIIVSGSGLLSLPHCSAPRAMGELLVKACKISRLQNVMGLGRLNFTAKLLQPRQLIWLMWVTGCFNECPSND